MTAIHLLTPRSSAVVSLATRRQASFREFVGKADPTLIPRWMNVDFRKGRKDLSIPKPVRFSWASDEPDKPALLELSEDRCFSSPVVRRECVSPAEVYNLKTGTRYFWRVNGGRARSFRTADTFVRMIRADGASNIRDVGSLRRADGTRLRQGLLYRGTEMDVHHEITESGIESLLALGIKTDLDIRGEPPENCTSSPLGDGVRYVNMPCLQYHTFIDAKNCRPLLEFLADERNYPIYIHCWAGADRTGTLMYVLETILGVSEDDRLAEYEITSLGIWGDRRRSKTGWGWGLFMEALSRYDGADNDARVFAFLRDCGVTDETCEKIRKIFTVCDTK